MYSKEEVVRMLVYNMNEVMKLIDKSKYYSIDEIKKEVKCYRKKFFKSDIPISTYTYDYIIQEAGGILK